MFVQIHMLQSMPPGNLNRDDSGQPKKCIFGGVTRGRISSQCLKRNIRLSAQFKEAYRENLASRTKYLPQMVAEQLQKGKQSLPDDELNMLMAALVNQFSKGEQANGSEEAQEPEASSRAYAADASNGQTPQLVFFTPPFTSKIASLILDLRKNKEQAYNYFIGRKSKTKLTKDDEKAIKADIEQFVKDVSLASKKLTVDIGLFGRMTTSDLVVNVEAACQVAHAISTHETVIESDYFTAMDDRKADYTTTQMKKAGAAFLGSGDSETYFNASVYYKYLNLDLEAIQKHLPDMSEQDAARVAGVLIHAAAFANPTGKQNSFASHGIPELILIEVSKTKRPISYANAFLQPVEGSNLMTESAKALCRYVDSVSTAYAPTGTHRVLFAVASAESVQLKNSHNRTDTLDQLTDHVVRMLADPKKLGATS